MFFQTFSQVISPGVDYNLTVSQNEGKMTVLVMPKISNLKDAAQTHLVPFSLCGTPDEIDRGFIAAIGQPLQRSAGLLTNMAQYEKQTERAASNSKAAKEAKSKEDKQAKEKGEKYDKHFKKAGEQEAAGDLSGAIQSLQQARLHAAEKDIKKVDDKIAEIKAAMSQGSLFEVEIPQHGEVQQAAPAPEPVAAPQPVQPVQQVQPQMQQQQMQQQPPQMQQPQPGYPGMFGQQPQQPQYAQQYPPQGYYPQGVPQQAQPGPIQPDPSFAPMDMPHNPADYAGMPDVHLTHVGEMMSHQSQL